MQFSLDHNGRSYSNMTVPDAAEIGIPAAEIVAAVKAVAEQAVVNLTDSYRAALASTSAGKLAEYRVKEEIAKDPASAAPAELDMIDREAAARGQTRDQLVADIIAKASSYRRIVLLVGAVEAEALAAVRAIPDDLDSLDANIEKTLAQIRSNAGEAIAAAKAEIESLA